MQDIATQPKNEVAVIFEKINTGLQAFEERKAVFTGLAKEASAIKDAERGDKGHRKLTTEHRKKMKNARVEVEKEGKAMRDPLNIVTKQISAKQGELVDIIAPGEKDLQEIEDWYEAQDARIEREEKERQAKRIQDRVDKLRDYGFEIDIAFLTAISDEDFEKVVDNAKAEHAKEEAAKAEQKRLEEEERERIRKERVELEELRAKQAEADRILLERQEEMDRKEREMKKKQEEAEAAEYEKAKKARDDEQKGRLDQLFKLGLKVDFSDNHYKGYGCFVAFIDIQCASAEEWEKMIAEITPVIERGKKKEQEEATEVEKVEKEKKAQEEERIRKEAADKALADQKEREAEAARQEAERIAQATDKEKFNMILSHLETLPSPAMRSAKHKKLLTEVQELRDKIISHIKAKA